MREPGNTTAIPGFRTQLTVTGPFVNMTWLPTSRDE
jgi:alpha-1,4-digalacturonate transport system substrate-binding protein